MNIQELISRLKKLPKNTMVVMSCDGEGNNYSPLSDLCIGYYTPENTWSGQFQSESNMEQEDIDNLEAGSEKVVCFFPVN